MKGFEAFEVRGWVDDIFVVLNDAAERALEVMPRSVNRVIAAAAVAVGAATSVVSFVEETTPSLYWSSQEDKSQQAANDDVPAGYWPRLVSSMASWGVASEDDDVVLPPVAV